MVETPFDPLGPDRSRTPARGPGSRPDGPRRDAELLDSNGQEDESGEWQLPSWVEDLDAVDLDLQEPEAEIAQALDVLDEGPPPAIPDRATTTGDQPRRSPGLRRGSPPEREEVGSDDAWGFDQGIESGVSWLMDLDDGRGGGEGQREEGGEPSFLAGLGRRPRRRSKLRFLVGMTLSIAAGVGAVLFYRQQLGEPERVPIARAPRPEPRPAASPSSTEPGASIASSPTTAAEPSAPVESAPTPELAGRSEAQRFLEERQRFLALADSHGAYRSAVALPFLLAHLSPETEVCEPEPSALAAEALPGGERETREQVLAAADMVLLPSVASPFREASESDMALIWLGTTIPIDVVDEPRKVLTPEVGRVRVQLHGGDVYDGKLYAVGERKVWLELNGARMALLSWQVQRIDHIEAEGRPGAAGRRESLSQVGLERVRVRTDGGVFYGRLMKRDGDEVTILSPEGARMSFRGATVESAGLSHTRIVEASQSGEPAIPRASAPRLPNASDAARPPRGPR